MNLYRNSFKEIHRSSPNSSPNGSPKDISQTQQKILDIILENPETTQTAMAEKLNITPRAIKKNIKYLSEKGLVEHVGSARKGYWKTNL